MEIPLVVWILGFSLVGGVFSLVGGVFLLLKKEWTKQYAFGLVSFAAGVLLGVAFLDLWPESLEIFEARGGGEVGGVFAAALAGVVLFFMLERLVIWFHHHHELHVAPPAVLMLVFGDTLHNFLDGVVITATFLVSVPLGVMTALAVAAHEVPEEIADFGVMLSLGMSRWRVFWINFVSSLATLVGAMIALLGMRWVQGFEPQLLAFTGGMFAYIALADLVPELHRKIEKKEIWGQTVGFFAGLAAVWGMGLVLGH